MSDPRLSAPAEPPPPLLMERRMLLTIRDLAERDARAGFAQRGAG